MNSRHVGGRFDALLGAMGFSHLIEKRLTPRLVFYVLGRDRKPIDSIPDKAGLARGAGAGRDARSEGKAEIEVEIGVEGDREREGEIEIKYGGKKRKVSVTSTNTGTGVPGKDQASDGTCVGTGRVEKDGDGAWKDLVQSAFTVHSDGNKRQGKGQAKGQGREVLDYFCRDFSSVPSSEFCLSMATVLDRVTVMKVKSRGTGSHKQNHKHKDMNEDEGDDIEIDKEKEEKEIGKGTGRGTEGSKGKGKLKRKER